MLTTPVLIQVATSVSAYTALESAIETEGFWPGGVNGGVVQSDQERCMCA